MTSLTAEQTAQLDAMRAKAETGEQFAELCRLEAEMLAATPTDPRDPDPTREGMFRDHNCYRCKSGERACVRGNPRNCEYPRARND